MKTKLEIAREEINSIDKEMIELFKKRIDAARLVAEYKKGNNLPIFDEAREKSLIEKNLKLLNDKSLEEYYLTFINGMLKASKDFQAEVMKEENI